MISSKHKQMTTGQIFTPIEILSMGLVELENPDYLKARIFLFDKQVYFFEPLSDNQLRLYSIISKRSFYL